MALINQLNVMFDYNQINALYDFYAVSTTEKYIPGGAYVLDKPNEDLKAESVVFDNGKTLFVMFRKGVIGRIKFIKQIQDEKLIVKQVSAVDIKAYILFRLFLYSLNNFESDSLFFNNITGKLYLCKPEWIKRSKDSFKALSLNVDAELNLLAEMVSFSKLSKFKAQKKFKDYPKYALANKNNCLKRVLLPEEGQEVYIKRALYNSKAELPFFVMTQKDLQNNKVYYIYHVLQLLKEKYTGLISFDFCEIPIINTIGSIRDDKFMERATRALAEDEISFVNLLKESEYKEDFYDLVNSLAKEFGSSSSIADTIQKDKMNVVLLHNKDYYEQNEYDDPYKKFRRNDVIQCVTIEDSADKIIDDKEAIINTIIKEMAIKKDILVSKKISLDDWNSYGFQADWIFGKEKDDKYYFIIVHPDGSFEFKDKADNFSSFGVEILDNCLEYLAENKGKEKTIIADSIGNIIVASRTNRYTLPLEELFHLKTISRSKESREKYLSGVVDINLFESNNEVFYNVGIKGSGMNTSIVRAPLLYKVDVIKGKNIIENILATLSVTFVKYKSFTVMPYPIKYLNEYILMK